MIVEVKTPAPAIIHCPYCHFRHVDAGEWKTRPHHKHLCLNCQKLFRIEPYCYGAPEEEFETCEECFDLYHVSDLKDIGTCTFIACPECRITIAEEGEKEQ